MAGDPIADAIRMTADRLAGEAHDLQVQRRVLVAEYMRTDRLWQARIAALDRMIADREAARREAVQAHRERRESERMDRRAA